MPKAPPPRGFMRLQWRLHKLIWKLSGARLGRRVDGMPVLRLVTTGHTSGRPRDVLLWYVDTKTGPVLAGTNAGADHDPAWIMNLRADPSATMTVEGVTTPVIAVFLDGEPHAAAWATLVAAHGGYRTYAEVLTRPVPIVRLSSRNGDEV